MTKASAVPVASVEVLSAYETVDGQGWLHVPCADDYETYKDLPNLVEFNGSRYGKSAFNSDRHVAYYSTGHVAKYATAVGA